jgi:hypothetical protein
VVVSWKLPGAKQIEITPAVIANVVAKIREGGPWRADAQSKDWVGLAIASVLGVDPSLKQEKKQLSTYIDRWIAAGVLVTRHGEDRWRKPRTYVEAPPPHAEAPPELPLASPGRVPQGNGGGA